MKDSYSLPNWRKLMGLDTLFNMNIMKTESVAVCHHPHRAFQDLFVKQTKLCLMRENNNAP